MKLFCLYIEDSSSRNNILLYFPMNKFVICLDIPGISSSVLILEYLIRELNKSTSRYITYSSKYGSNKTLPNFWDHEI